MSKADQALAALIDAATTGRFATAEAMLAALRGMYEGDGALAVDPRPIPRGLQIGNHNQQTNVW